MLFGSNDFRRRCSRVHRKRDLKGFVERVFVVGSSEIRTKRVFSELMLLNISETRTHVFRMRRGFMSGSLETRFVIIFLINKNSFKNRFFKKNLYPRTQKTHVGKIMKIS